MEEKNLPLGENSESDSNAETINSNSLSQTQETENAPIIPDTSASQGNGDVPSSPEEHTESAPTAEANDEEKKETEPTVYAYRWNYAEQAEYDNSVKKKTEAHGVRNFAIIMSIALVLSICTLVGVLFIGEGSAIGQGYGSVSLNELYNTCYPSYVAISVSSELGASSCGSGIVMTGDGYIATNYHVVEDGKNISVILSDGSSHPAEYIDGDELNDIAIIKIDKRGLTPAVIGSSANAKVGEQVMAIGTPYSIQYRGTMTSGYISALNRKYAAKNENGTVNKVITLLQTDTSVNPGNSGGPLFNMNGEVIGIVSMKISGSQYEGMGFAIPIDGVIDMLNDIIKNGKLTIPNGGSAVEGAALGLSGFSVSKDTKYLLTEQYHYVVEEEDGREIVNYVTSLGSILPIPLDDEELLEKYGITDYTFYTAPQSGVLVISTTDGFDSSKKLKENDIITSANGISCEYMETLQELIASSRVGDVLALEVFRDGKTVTVSVELGRSAAME